MAGAYEDDGQRKKRLIIIGVCSFLLVAMVVGVVVGVVVKRNGDNKKSGNDQIATAVKAIKEICQPTDYKDVCESTLEKAAGSTTDPKELIRLAFRVAMEHIDEAAKRSSVLRKLESDKMASRALRQCRELFLFAINDLKRVFEQLGEFDLNKIEHLLGDLKVWLSAAITYQETCLDGFQNTTGDAGEQMREALKTAKQLTSNGLAIVTEMASTFKDLNPSTTSRRLLASPGEFPSWVDAKRRRLLESKPIDLEPNLIVAKDGSGKYKKIGHALKVVPSNKKRGSEPFVIYIKEGVYDEQLEIFSNMSNLVLIGDGPTKTKLTGNRNNKDGWTTYKSATLAVVGDNFIAKDIGFENAAGPEKHQAVALRVNSDMSVFYNCQIDGYQDTLYAHTNRQFYRDCTISGTIDFIFGNAAAVFQNCKILIRKPAPKQNNIVTAQGRKEPREPTGLVLQNCTITADRTLKADKTGHKSYLARPWKEYSRTIIMESFIDDIIEPEGYLSWDNQGFGEKTLYYSEYENRGPGSEIDKRVKWKGIKTITPQQAIGYTPGKFIESDVEKWIGETGVPYTAGMTNPPSS